jgi:hypothetical protein
MQMRTLRVRVANVFVGEKLQEKERGKTLVLGVRARDDEG